MKQTSYDFFVGSYGTETEETIHWLTFHEEDGRITKKAAIDGVINPSFVTLDQRNQYMYAVSEIESGEVVAYQINETTTSLQEVNRQETKGGPCFVEVTPTNDYLLTANFGNGSVIVHPIGASGELQAASDYHNYTDLAKVSDRPSSNVHAIRHIPATNWYIATDLGLDKLFIYTLTAAGSLQQIKEVDVPEGYGPRHITFHPKQSIFYIINEHQSMICSYYYDLKEEKVELKQVISTLPEDYTGDNYCADIHITLSGKYLYASNRGHHSITAYEVAEDGRLNYISNHLLEGEWPRNFAIVPNEKFILIANEHSNCIEVFQLLENGALSPLKQNYSINKPVCISFRNVDMTGK